MVTCTWYWQEVNGLEDCWLLEGILLFKKKHECGLKKPVIVLTSKVTPTYPKRDWRKQVVKSTSLPTKPYSPVPTWDEALEENRQRIICPQTHLSSLGSTGKWLLGGHTKALPPLPGKEVFVTPYVVGFYNSGGLVTTACFSFFPFLNGIFLLVILFLLGGCTLGICVIGGKGGNFSFCL